jgi:hypothetical protein
MEAHMEDFIYKLNILAAVSVVVITFWNIAEIIIFRVPPSPLWIVLTAFNWAILFTMNPFWKDVWRKK